MVMSGDHKSFLTEDEESAKRKSSSEGLLTKEDLIAMVELWRRNETLLNAD